MTNVEQMQMIFDEMEKIAASADRLLAAQRGVIDAKNAEIDALKLKLAAHGESTCHKAVTFTDDSSRMCVDCGVVL